MSNNSTNKTSNKSKNEDKIKLETTMETKQETKQEAMVETKQDTTEETKEETKQEAMVETKQEAMVETKQEAMVETKQETKEDTAEETKEETKQEAKQDTTEEAKNKEEIIDNNNFFGETKENIFLKETLLDIENKDIELSSDEEDDEIVKIENNIEYNILDKYHPEIKQLNNNELNSKIIIKRNKEGIIDDSNHTTIPIMTRYERAKIIGFRATQINSGADILIDIPDNIIDGITIAKMELQQKKIPFIVRRPLPNGKSEYWNINDLEILE